MKKIFVLASLFAFAAVSCEKSDISDVTAEKTITIVAKTAGYDTRTTVEDNGDKTYTVKWTAGDQLYLGYFQDSGNNGFAVKGIQNISEDGTRCTLSLDNKGAETKNEGVCILYPSSATIGTPSHSGPNKRFFLNVPDTQTSDNGPDPKASLMFSQFPHPSPSTGDDSYAECVFKHVMAYGKINLKNFDSTATSVKFIVNDEGAELTGKTYAYNWVTNQVESGEKGAEYWYINANQQATTTVNNYVTVNTTGNEGIWFAILPSYEKAYKSFTVEVTTAVSTYTKNFTVGDGVQFNVGKVRPINVDMSTATAK